MKTLTSLAVLLFTLPAFANSVTMPIPPGNTVAITPNHTLFVCDQCSVQGKGFAFDIYNFGTPSATGWVYLSSSILFVGGFTSTAWNPVTDILTATFSGYAISYQKNGLPSSFGKTLVTGSFTEHITPCSNCRGIFGITGDGSITLSAMPPAVPEPSALVLVGTGLLGVGWKGLKTVLGSLPHR